MNKNAPKFGETQSQNIQKKFIYNFGPGILQNSRSGSDCKLEIGSVGFNKTSVQTSRLIKTTAQS